MTWNSWSEKELAKRGTSWKTEWISGTTTFMTMSYIIFIHPSILSEAGMDRGALITITCLVTFLSTLMVGLWANVPFAMAPGMGLNAFFTYSLVLGQGLSWQTALGIVFFSGILFLVLTLVGGRERIAHAIPESIRHAVGAGIGLFIAFIGFQKMGLVEANTQTLVQFGSLNLSSCISLLAFVLMVFLEIKKVKGSILLGIGLATFFAILANISSAPESLMSQPASISAHAFQLDLGEALQWSLVSAILSFMFVDLFDSVSTIVACSHEAGLLGKDKKIKSFGKVLEVDAFATVFGALLGTSTTTAYIESAAGISAGARTGLSSVVVALWFLLALFFAPLINIVPDLAIGPALVLVGIFLFKSTMRINWTDLNESIPAFLTIVIMPMTFNIGLGLSFGFISYVLIAVFKGNTEKVSVLLWIMGILSLMNLVLLTH